MLCDTLPSLFQVFNLPFNLPSPLSLSPLYLSQGVLELGKESTAGSLSSRDWKSRLFVLRRDPVTKTSTLYTYKDTKKKWQKQVHTHTHTHTHLPELETTCSGAWTRESVVWVARDHLQWTRESVVWVARDHLQWGL